MLFFVLDFSKGLNLHETLLTGLGDAWVGVEMRLADFLVLGFLAVLFLELV